VFEKFENIFVVNLESRKDRRRETERELARIGVSNAKFFRAIQPVSSAKFGSIGEHGCFMSHLTILKDCIGSKNVLVLEDDICFSQNFTEQAQLFNSLPTDWEVFYGGYGQLATQGGKIAGNGLIEVNRTAEFIGTHFYAVNGLAISRLAKAYDVFLTRDRGHLEGGPMPVDGAMNVARRQLNLRTFITIPPLATQRSSRTDVGNRKWFDNTPIVRSAVDVVRGIKNRLRQ
jgi:glycosyl transferase, family 25